MHALDRQRVFDPRPIVLALRIGQPPLGIQQQVQQPRLLVLVRVLVDGFQGLQLLAGGLLPVVIRLRHDVGPFDVGESRAQIVNHLPLLFFQDRPFPGQQQFGVSHRHMALPESQGRCAFHAQLPLLKVAAGQVAVGVVKAVERVAVGIEQIVSQAAPAVAADRIQSRQQEIPRGGQLQFAAAGHVIGIIVVARRHLDGDIAFGLAHQALADDAGLHLVALAAGIGAVVDPEGHRQRRRVDRPRGDR